jgi:hypothetical protein
MPDGGRDVPVFRVREAAQCLDTVRNRTCAKLLILAKMVPSLGPEHQVTSPPEIGHLASVEALRLSGVRKRMIAPPPPPIPRPDGIPGAMIMTWMDNTQLIKSTSTDLNCRARLDSCNRMVGGPSHQKVKTDVKRTRIEKDEQRCMMKFSSCRERGTKRYIDNLLKSLEKQLLVSSQSSVGVVAYNRATFLLMTSPDRGDLRMTLGKRYLSFSISQFLNFSERSCLFCMCPREEACNKPAPNQRHPHMRIGNETIHVKISVP